MARFHTSVALVSSQRAPAEHAAGSCGAAAGSEAWFMARDSQRAGFLRCQRAGSDGKADRELSADALAARPAMNSYAPAVNVWPAQCEVEQRGNTSVGIPPGGENYPPGRCGLALICRLSPGACGLDAFPLSTRLAFPFRVLWCAAVLLSRGSSARAVSLGARQAHTAVRSALEIGDGAFCLNAEATVRG